MARKPPPDASYAATLDRLLEVVVLLEGDMQRELTARGLTRSRTHVLWLLGTRPPGHQRELAEALDVSPRTVTGLVDGLESTGFVRRQPDPSDRRAVNVELTTKGRQTADWLLSSHAELAAELFGDMGAARYAGFSAGLSEVRDRLAAALEVTAQKGGSA